MKIALPLLGVLLILALLSPASNIRIFPEEPPSADTSARYTWNQLTSEADFPRSSNFQMFSDGGKLWLLHSQGIWSSRDGALWKKSGLNNVLANTEFLKYVQFGGMIYALGAFHGNAGKHWQSTQIARTTDFKRWEIVARYSNLPKRYFYNPVVFQGKIWIFGGEDDTSKYADAWNSTDAVHWRKAADGLPFGKRTWAHFAVFHGDLVMLDYDAWSSQDGLTWKQLTPRIADGEMFGYSVEVYDGRIWLIGCNRNGKFRSQIFSSADGITWTASDAPWSPRGGVATCQFFEKIVMAGGGPGLVGQSEFVYNNEVWTFGKP